MAFLIPSRYLPVMYAVLATCGLLVALLLGVRLHLDKLVQTHCRNYQYWPSISSTIGDFLPERAIWRVVIAIGGVIRFTAGVLLMKQFSQVLCAAAGQSSSVASSGLVSSLWSLLKLVVTGGFNLAEWMLIFDVLRMLAAFMWTYVASSEFLHYHDWAFRIYMVMGLCLQLTSVRLAYIATKYPAQGQSPKTALLSYRLKVLGLLGQTCAAFGVAKFALVDHYAHCWPGGYSRASMCEWTFSIFNILFDATGYFDLQGCVVLGIREGCYAIPASAAQLNRKLEKSEDGDAMTEDKAAAACTYLTLSASSTMHSNESATPIIPFDCRSVPCNAALWFAEIFFSYHFWNTTSQLYQEMYFLPMVAMEFTSEAAMIAAPIAAWIFRQKTVFQFFAPASNQGRNGYVLCYFLSLLVLFCYDVRSRPDRLLFVMGTGPLFLWMATHVRFFSLGTESSAVRTRMIYSVPLGLCVCMILRVYFVSIDPVYTEPVHNVLGLLFGIFSAWVMARFAFRPGASLPSSPHQQPSLCLTHQQPALAGMAYSLFIGISIMFATAPGVSARYLNIEPYPSQILVVLVFLLGIACVATAKSPFPSLLQPWCRQLAETRVLSAMMVGGAVVLYYATGQSRKSVLKPGFPEITHNTPLGDMNYYKDWELTTTWGFPALGFLGGLAFVFGIGFLWPILLDLIFPSGATMTEEVLPTTNMPTTVPPHQSTVVDKFEVTSFIALAIMLFANVYVVCFPFVPAGFLLKDRLNIVMICPTVAILCIIHQLRSPSSSSSVDSSPGRSNGCAAKSTTASTPPPRLFSIFLFFLFAVITARWIGSNDNSMMGGAEKTMSTKEIKKYAAHSMQWIMATEQLDTRDPDYDDNVKSKAQMQRIVGQALTEAERNVLADIAPITAMIWTLHFAYDDFGVDSMERLTRMIASTKASIIGLLETDVTRLMTGNRDIVEYVSYYLGYPYTEFGPTTLDSTFGCALITKFPILHSERIVTPSPVGEYGCAIDAVLNVHGFPLRVMVGHNGNTPHLWDRRLQSQQLGDLAAKSHMPCIFLGYLTSAPRKANYHYFARQEAGLPAMSKGQGHLYEKMGSADLFKDTAYTMYQREKWTEIDLVNQAEKEKDESVESLDQEESGDKGGVQSLTQKKQLLEHHRQKENQLDSVFNHDQDGPVHEYSEKFLEELALFKPFNISLPERGFKFPLSGRISPFHPRWEYFDRYCQYILYKPGKIIPSDAYKDGRGARPKTDDEHTVPQEKDVVLELYDWYRLLEMEHLSDTEIQVGKFSFQIAQSNNHHHSHKNSQEEKRKKKERNE